MQSLKDLLQIVPTKNHSEWFQTIAKVLLCNYHIETTIEKYRITEIEFYYYSDTHKDETTYGYIKEGFKYKDRISRHKNAQRKQLSWFFHYSGIDIVFGNENNLGGILIRAIQNVNNLETLAGPLVVLIELLNQSADVEGNKPLLLRLIRIKDPYAYNLQSKKRVGLGIGKFKDELYNYSADEFHV